MLNYRSAVGIQREKQNRFSKEPKRDEGSKQRQIQRWGAAGGLLDRVGPRPIIKLVSFLVALAIAVTAATAPPTQQEAEAEVKVVNVVEQTDASNPEAHTNEASESGVVGSEKKLSGGPAGPLTGE